jgi:hypothetical protein
VPASSRWALEGFLERFRALDPDVPAHVREAFAQWLQHLAHSPFDVHHTELVAGTYLGDPERGEPALVPFPPIFEAWIEADFTVEALVCSYTVDPDTRIVRCRDLRYQPRAKEWQV